MNEEYIYAYANTTDSTLSISGLVFFCTTWERGFEDEWNFMLTARMAHWGHAQTLEMYFVSYVYG